MFTMNVIPQRLFREDQKWSISECKGLQRQEMVYIGQLDVDLGVIGKDEAAASEAPSHAW